MRKTIPVIRAAALIPLLKFLIQRKHPVEQILRDAGIGYVWIEDPYAPIPIKALEKVTARAAQLEGPEVGCRAVTENSLRDIAALGAIALGARSPREALQRVSAAMPFHCSHELISLKPGDARSVMLDAWMLPIQPESLHVIQQFVAALVQMLLQRAVADEPVVERLSIVPHPEHGLDHLRGWFPGTIVAAQRPVLEMTIKTAYLDTLYRQVARDRLPQIQKFPWQRLRDGTMVGSASFLLKAMLHDGIPTIERLSECADYEPAHPAAALCRGRNQLFRTGRRRPPHRRDGGAEPVRHNHWRRGCECRLFAPVQSDPRRAPLDRGPAHRPAHGPAPGGGIGQPDSSRRRAAGGKTGAHRPYQSWNANTLPQSAAMSTTVQPCAAASSSPRTSRPTWLSRS